MDIVKAVPTGVAILLKEGAARVNFQTMKNIAENPDMQWYMNQKQVAALLGCTRQYAAAFLQEHSVPYRKLGAAKRYFLPEVLEAVDKTKWS